MRSLRQRFNRAARGLALAELLISLAISAALLTATGYALNAAIVAYKVNTEQATLLQSARLAMYRVVTTVRRSALHAPDDATLSANFVAGKTVTGGGVMMFDENGNQSTYHYDAANRCITFTSNGHTTALVRGVDDFQVTLEPMRSATSIRSGGGWDLVKRATFLLTISSSDRTIMQNEGTPMSLTLSASTMPRRNTW